MMLGQTIRSRWFVTTLHVGLWVVLALTLYRLRGTAPEYQETTSHTTPAYSPVPVARLESLFTPETLTGHLAPTNGVNPFATRHFIPTVIPPPPPTTRKFEVTYQGFYQTGDNPKRVFVQLDSALLVSTIGARLATNLYVAEATFTNLTLTNPVPQTNVVKLNTKQVVEVPLQ
jgi:hypothetical protein